MTERWLSDKTVDHLRAMTERPDLSHTKYRCLQKIARGGMGTIFLAEDTELHRKIALKVLDIPDEEGQLASRMLQEAYIIAELEHPGIVPIHDVGTLADGRIFYTMKLVQGQRLNEKIADPNATLTECLRIIQKICEAVEFAHTRGVLHRDLKPENIMVGEFGEVLVMDWGLAKKISGDRSSPSSPKTGTEQPGGGQSERDGVLTEHGTVMGTPAYMAPEQERGEIEQIDHRTDIYALGAILDFALKSKTESPGRSELHPSPLTRHYQHWFSRVPRQLLAIRDKAMSPRKTDRYDRADQIKHDIENYLNGERVTAYKENALEKCWRALKPYRFLTLLILVYILSKLLTLFLFN